MPNKTIYVAEGDLQLLTRAQALSGGNLSATITIALRRFVDAEEGSRDGYEVVTLRVGPGAGRKVRFTGVLLGEWRGTRVYRTRKGRFVVHTERAFDVAGTVEELCELIPAELGELGADLLDQPPIEDLDI